MEFSKLIVTALICTSLFSCKTYTIPAESFKEQFRDVNPLVMKPDKNSNVDVGLTQIKFTYKSNRYKIKDIKGINKKGESEIIQNSPSIEMRVTLRNTKKYHFFFDTVYLENDTLKGGKSRLFPKMITKIPFDSIAKIEVQDGGKRYKSS